MYEVSDLYGRTLLQVSFPIVGPNKTTAYVYGAGGRMLGKVLSGVWLWSEYFDAFGSALGVLRPPAWPGSPVSAAVHYDGRQRGEMQILNDCEIHWASDTARYRSPDDLPLVARIRSGWTEEESQLLEYHAPPGQSAGYVISGADRGRMLTTGMAVFAYEVLL